MKKEIYTASEAKIELIKSAPKYLALLDENRSSILPFNVKEDDKKTQLNLIFRKLETDPFLSNGIFIVRVRDSKQHGAKCFEIKIKQGEGVSTFAEQPKKTEKLETLNTNSSIVTQTEWLKMIQENTTMKIEIENYKKQIQELEIVISELEEEEKGKGFFENESNIEKLSPFIERGFTLVEGLMDSLFSARTKGTTTKTPTRATTVKPWIKPTQQQQQQQQQPTQQPYVNTMQPTQQQQEQEQDRANINQLTNEVITQAGNSPENLEKLLKQVQEVYPAYFEQVYTNVMAFYQAEKEEQTNVE